MKSGGENMAGKDTYSTGRSAGDVDGSDRGGGSNEGEDGETHSEFGIYVRVSVYFVDVLCRRMLELWD